MSLFELFFDFNSIFFFLMGVIAAGVLVGISPRRRRSEELIEMLVRCYFVFSGFIRFTMLAIACIFFPSLLVPNALQGVGDYTFPILGMAFVSFALLSIAAFRASVPVRIVAIIPLAVFQIGQGTVFFLVDFWRVESSLLATIDSVGVILVGLAGAVLVAFDWANRSEQPDPLTPEGKRLTY